MSSFGKWYEEQKAPEPGTAAPSGGSGSWGLFNSTTSDGGDEESQNLAGNGEGGGGFSLSSMRSSLEAQLPQKIMGMNYQQRFQMFCALLCLSALFFGLGFAVGLPLITIRPQKFALCFTCGSLTFMCSFGILKGPWAHFSGMLAADRLPFTAVYLGSMLLTLHFTFKAGGATGYVTVLASSALQLLALLWYLISFLPGGSAGMKVLVSAIYTLLKPVIVGCAKLQAMCVAQCLSFMTR